MDINAAILALSSDEPKLRTQAVRRLGALGDRSAIEPLNDRLRVERVTFLKRLIVASIERLKTGQDSDAKNKRVDERTDIDVDTGDYQKAVQFVSGILMHEISSKVGLLKYSAQKEIPSYEESQTRHTLERLDDVIAGIASLRKATFPNQMDSFKIYGFLQKIVDEVCVEDSVKVHLQDRKGTEIIGDIGLLSLAFQNGLKNAYEAVLRSEKHELIVVSWGQTDVENYISILDQGGGITGPQDAAFEVGKTNKKGHSGFGLAIARMAMTTILGTVNLYPSELGGMRFEMRWPKDD